MDDLDELKLAFTLAVVHGSASKNQVMNPDFADEMGYGSMSEFQEQLIETGIGLAEIFHSKVFKKKMRH
tara:strand:+ start:544 stop:750 length:207 start_codon:yes stop_codon:yes gene_type:complete